MQHWKKRALSLLLAGLLAASVTACGGSPTEETPGSESTPPATGSETSSGEPKYGGILTAYTSADPKSFDPATLSAWDQTIVAANLLEGLVRLNPEGTDIEPGIAEDWPVSEDGLVWTFNLRDNAKFHNGRDVVAQDFKYSFERVPTPTPPPPPPGCSTSWLALTSIRPVLPTRSPASRWWTTTPWS